MATQSFQPVRVFSGFSVNDLEVAKHFYSQVLNCEVVESPEGLGLRLPGGGEVFMYPKPDHVPATYTILNFVISDIETSVDQLVEAGVNFEHYSDEYLKTDAKGICRGPEGPYAIAWFKDPAGNILSLIQEHK